MAVRYSALLLLTILLPLAGQAQPTLNFKRVEVRYPEITLAFKATCAGLYKRDMQSQQFEVRENGFLVKDVTLLCPPDDSCCVSTCLVLDRTGSMSDKPVPKISRLKTAANIYVDLMQTPCDEAALVSFNSDVSVDVPMTTSKPSLKSAINRLTATGNTALWDAAHEGVKQLAASARNRCKAVILFTDGGENSSRDYLFRDVLTRALNEHVRVFTIGYGIIEGSVWEDTLKYLAESTGGTYYYSPVEGDLNSLFRSMRMSITEAYRECVISYRSGCPDGSFRTVNLTLKDYCGGTVTQTRTYQAPLDRSAFQEIKVRLGSATVMGTRDVVVPLLLETPVNGIFSKCDLTVVYDRSLATLRSISTAGTLLEGVGTSLADVGSGHTIYIRDHKEISGMGPLLYLTFRAGDVVYDAKTFLHISNWNMYAYCLTPKVVDGEITITPREPQLACSTELPERIEWDDDKKDYVPNPFTATVRIANTGTREARNLRARISFTSTKIALSSPQVYEQDVLPRVVNPGQEGTASWDLRTFKLQNADSMRICFTVTADNHAPIECCRTLYVNPAQASALACTLTAPDTVFFREQYYEPEEFDIGLAAVNTGSGQTKRVVGQLLQDTRFTITTAAAQTLADVLPPMQSASGSFRVRMHPRDTDGYDTIRAHVQGNDTDPAWCEKPIWVQRLRWPAFSLACTTPDAELEFDEASGGYVPNPFPVTTTAVNTGETYAEECQILFVGPPRFTPVGTNLRPAGTMQIGDRRIEQWMIRALPRAVAGWDTLVFQVLGKGGLGRKIALAECRLPIHVPEMRAPSYQLSCTAPDSLRYERNAYTPDPFRFEMRITNTGTATGRGLRIAPVLPPTVQLAPGERAERVIDELAPNESADLAWMLTVERRNSDDLVRICGRIADEAGISGECCRDVFIPRVAPPRLQLSCISIDTLFIDTRTGEYAGNPFLVSATVTNTGLGTAEDVRASIALLAPMVQLADDADVLLGDIPPAGSMPVQWRVRALRRVAPGDVPIRVAVASSNHDALTCMRSVFIPVTHAPELAASCWSDPADSLFFNWYSGRYDPGSFTVHLRVTNIGAFRANDVTAMLVAPPGVVLAEGESTQKSIAPSVLEPGQIGVASWTLVPLRQNSDALRGFRFLARASNAYDAECTDGLFVQGAPRRLTVSIPQDMLFQYGEKRQIPVSIDRSVGVGLSSYRFDLVFDPAVLSLLQISNQGTHTERGWVGPVMYELEPGRVSISDYSTNTAINTDPGLLVLLQAEGVWRGNGGAGSFARSDLRIDTETLVMNNGDILPRAEHGSVYVTDDCLEPLEANASFSLEQNRPNPFSTETVISFTLAAETDVKLGVYDRMGRLIALLAEGTHRAGAHTVRYDASTLEAGLYFCRLEMPGRIDVRKMLRK